MIDWSHFLVGALTATGLVLGQVILALVKKRNGNGNGNGYGDRVTLADVREDIRELHKKIEPLVTEIAVIKRDVAYLQQHCPLLEDRRR